MTQQNEHDVNSNQRNSMAVGLHHWNKDSVPNGILISIYTGSKYGFMTVF